MECEKMSIESARREAKRRKRADNIKYQQALEQVAVEQGFANWSEMRKEREANPVPEPEPDFIVHLTGIDQPDVRKEVWVLMKDLLVFSGLVPAEWEESSPDEKEQLLIEFALGIRQKRADFTRYYAEVVSGLAPDADDPAAPMFS